MTIVTAAFVMPEFIISRPAQGITIFSIVMSGADHSVLILQLGVTLLMNSMCPIFASVQLVLCGKSADQSIATCNRNQIFMLGQTLYKILLIKYVLYCTERQGYFGLKVANLILCGQSADQSMAT